MRGVLPDAASLDAWLRRHRRRCLLYENQSGSQSAYCFSCRMEAASTLHGLFLCCRGHGRGRCAGWRGGLCSSAPPRPHEAQSDEARGPCFHPFPWSPLTNTRASAQEVRQRSVRGPPLTEIRESSCQRRRRDLVFDDHCGAARLHLPFFHPASDRMGLFTNSCCGKEKRKKLSVTKHCRQSGKSEWVLLLFFLFFLFF